MKNFSPLSKKIFIDVDKRELIKRNIKSTIQFNNDVSLFLDNINNKIKKINYKKKLD